MNLFTLFGRISVDNAQANKAIDETSGYANEARGALSRIGSAAGKVGSVMVKGLAAGTAAAGAALVALTKNAVSYYSDYEQLVGGVETLFKDSGETVMKYAADAYKTAGLSANEYMDTVTSFSASLLQSLGQDTALAADVAHVAITDMADNANKMGTNMTLIQNAYQGFAKQNYTMLDNLKLGYGGTQAEMKRLLQDAQRIKKEQGENVKYSIDSFADIVEAIHVVQEEMGITGTTAEEASETIQGSIGMMKAAWKNFLTGMADSNQDFNALTTNLVNSVITVANNIVPRLIETVPRLVEGIAAIGQQLAGYLPEMISGLLPSLIAGVASLISALVTQIPALLSSVGQAISTAWTDTVWPMIQNAFKAIFGVELPDWGNLGATISTAMETVVWPEIQKWFSRYFNIELPDWENLKTEISAGWETIVWPEIQKWFSQKFDIELPDWETIKTDTSTALSQIGETISSKLQPAINTLSNAFGNVISAISGFIGWIASGSAGAETFKTVVVAVTAALVAYKAAMMISAVIQGVTTAINAASAAFGLFNATLLANPIVLIVALIAGLVAGLVWLYNTNENVRNAIDTAWAAIKTAIETCCNAINGFIQGIIDLWENWSPSIKRLFVIESAGGDLQDAENNEGTIRYQQEHGVELPTVTYHDVPAAPNAAGAVFSAPTIFDTRLGRQMVGEAGPEAVAPISVLRQYVREEVEAANVKQNDGTKEALQYLIESLPDMMVNAFAAVKVDVNNREFARLVKAVN